MKTLSMPHLWVAVSLFCLGLIMPTTSSAQICQPCAQGSYYVIDVGPLSGVSITNVTTRVNHMSTGSYVDQTLWGPVNGWNYVQFPTAPLGNFGISTITITTNLGTIYEIYCTGDGTYVCYPIGNPTKWLKITFIAAGSPGAAPNACWTIKIESVAGPC